MNKKILIISLSFFFTLVLITFNAYTLEVSNFSNAIDSFKDNYIIANVNKPINSSDSSNGFAYTKEEEELIQNMEHIKKVDFFNQYSFYENQNTLTFTYPQQGELQQEYNKTNIYFKSNSATDFNPLDENLKYIYGHKLSQDNGIVISEQLANFLIKYNLFNTNKKEELIGQTFYKYGFDFEIEGIYKTKFTTLPKTHFFNYESYSKDTVYYNSFISNNSISDFYTPIFSDQEIINAINEWNSFKGSEPTNEGKIKYTQVLNNNTFETVVDYDKSVKKGATGLINPDDFDKYDNHLYDGAIIEIDDVQNKQSVINNLKEINNIDNIVTSDTKMSDITNYPRSIKYILFSFIILFILLYYRYFNCNLKSSFINILISSIISIIIATTLCFILPINVFISNTIIVLALAFICICFITLIKYSIIKMGNKD